MGIYVTDASGNRKKVAGIGKIKEIPDGSITGDKLAVGAVTNSKLDDGSVSWSKMTEDSRPIQKNLLMNWYFVGGGSQKGDGLFPINQRGETEYTSAAYSIDGWIVRGNSIKCYFDTNGDFVIGTSTGTVARGFIQCMGDFNQYAGKKVTISLLYKSLIGDAGSAIGFSLYGGDTSQSVSQNFGGEFNTDQNGLVTMTITLPQTSQYKYLNAYISLKNYVVNQSAVLIAAKLELSDHQTLAHQDADGNWVLNEIPDYGEELAKCRGYLRVYDFTNAYVISGYISSDGKFLYLDSWVSDGMRISPTPSLEDVTVTIRTINGYSAVATFDTPGNVTSVSMESGIVRMVLNNSVLGVNNTPIVSQFRSGKLILDAGL